MKKILLFLIFLTSFLFSENGQISGSAPSYLKVGTIYYKKSSLISSGNEYVYGELTSQNGWFPPPYYVPYSPDGYGNLPVKDVTNEASSNGLWYYRKQNTYNYVKLASLDCVFPNSIINGECSAPPAPVCPLGQHNDPTDAQNCIDDFPITNTEYLVGGGVLLKYADNKMMLLRRDGTAESWDLETGEYYYPNRAFDGVVPPSASYNPLSFDQSIPIEYKELGFGDFVAFKFNQAGIALQDASKWLGAPVALPIFWAISGHRETPEENLVKTGTVVTVEQHTLDNIDFSSYENSATATSQTIPNTDMQVQKITTPTHNWAGVGELGSVIVSTPYNPNKALITTPTEVKLVQKNADGSVQETSFKKSDLANTASTNADLPVTQKVIQPEKMANDGTYSQVQETLNGLVSPRITAPPIGVTPPTNSFEGLSKSTGLPDVVDFNPATGTKDGNLYNTSTGLKVGTNAGTGAGISPTAPTKDANGLGTGSIDLSGVTGRLDKMSNQLTKLNNFTDKFTFSDDNDPIAVTEHTIPTDTSSGDWNTYSTTLNNLKSDITNLMTKGDEVKALFQNGFSLNFTTGVQLTCPYTATIDLSNGHTFDIPIDFCKVFSPFRPVFYTIFYLFFVYLILSFALKSLIRLA